MNNADLEILLREALWHETQAAVFLRDNPQIAKSTHHEPYAAILRAAVAMIRRMPVTTDGVFVEVYKHYWSAEVCCLPLKIEILEYQLLWIGADQVITLRRIGVEGEDAITTTMADNYLYSTQAKARAAADEEEARAAERARAGDDGELDQSPCMECGRIIKCVPDGMPLCGECADQLKREDQQQASQGDQ